MGTGNVRRFAVSVILSAVVGGLFVVPAAASEPACSDPLTLESFKVRLAGYKAKYAVGDTVIFNALVTRHVNGVGIAPAEGARLVVGVSVGRVVIGAGGTTDANGSVDIDLRLRRYLPAGRADVWAFASKEIEDVPCHAYEWGSVELPRLFRVTR